MKTNHSSILNFTGKVLSKSVYLVVVSVGSLVLTSCFENNKELIGKIETTQGLLEQQDSVLEKNQKELTSFFFPDSIGEAIKINPLDSLQKVYVENHATLINDFDSLLIQNKTLLEALNNKSIDGKDAEIKYSEILSKLENIKTNDASIMTEYKKLEEKLNDTFKNLNDAK